MKTGLQKKRKMMLFAFYLPGLLCFTTARDNRGTGTDVFSRIGVEAAGTMPGYDEIPEAEFIISLCKRA
jgi:hypothetical protein